MHESQQHRLVQLYALYFGVSCNSGMQCPMKLEQTLEDCGAPTGYMYVTRKKIYCGCAVHSQHEDN